MSKDKIYIFDTTLRDGAQTEGGDFSIKLEDQVLITADGYENLTKYPFDQKLMGYS